jgi:hypothetical protein
MTILKEYEELTKIAQNPKSQQPGGVLAPIFANP